MEVLTPLIERRLLPNFQRLLERSSYGRLQTDEALSPVSWTSIAAGKARSKTLDETRGNIVWELDASAVRVKRLWDLLAGPNGEGAAIVNYYFMPEHDRLPKATLVDGRDGELRFANILGPRAFTRAERQLRRTTATDAAEQILSTQNDLRVFASIESETDYRQHTRLFFFLMNVHPGFRRFAPVKVLYDLFKDETRELVRTYLRVDRMIGFLLDRYRDDYIFVVSDHGFHVKAPTMTLDPPYIWSNYGTDRLWFYQRYSFPVLGFGDTESIWSYHSTRLRVRRVRNPRKDDLFRRSANRGGAVFERPV
ncbi:MAG: alkaline phosphatase family protein [Deltaproteobacteria bacterium]|nr:alkaline phosphatase family protein [Deltaproteobacteria bacterium]